MVSLKGRYPDNLKKQVEKALRITLSDGNYSKNENGVPLVVT